MSSARPSKRLRLLQAFNTLLMLSLGAIIQALAVVVFFAPSTIAPGGVSGGAIIINHLTPIPIGILILIGNIPIQILAYRMLGGGRIISRTVYSIIVYSLAIDFLTPILDKPMSQEPLLNAIFGGVLSGIGVGLVHGAGGTAGGTATLARILQHRFGVPISSAYLYTDTLIIIAAGLVFGGEAAMLALVALFLSGIASDYTLEGPSVIRTLTIITNQPATVAEALISQLGRGVTAWDGQGMYTQQARSILFLVVSRPQVTHAREIIKAIDPGAFIVVGQGHAAYGQGFRRITGGPHDIKIQPVEATEIIVPDQA